MNIDAPTAKPPKKRKGPRPLTDEEKEEKEVAKEASANNKRFQLIVTISRQHGVNSLKHGVWDESAGAVVFLSHTRQEAAAEMARLRAGKSHASNHNN